MKNNQPRLARYLAITLAIATATLNASLSASRASAQEATKESKKPAKPAADALTVDPKQDAWYQKYKKQENIPAPEDMLINTAKEPNLKRGFKPLFNGKDLDDWTPRGGNCTFEVVDGMIVGTCVPGSPSTYLSTKRDDYTDFVFTCEMKWEEDGNSGVMFRAKLKDGEKGEVVYGPQAEMEGISGDRYWNGGIYGQSCGGYFYPVWLKGHEKARGALDREGWNRLTIRAKGNDVKTWVNGVPVAHWKDDGSYPKGYFGLQVHAGKKGKVIWRDVRVKELKATPKKKKNAK